MSAITRRNLIRRAAIVTAAAPLAAVPIALAADDGEVVETWTIRRGPAHGFPDCLILESPDGEFRAGAQIGSLPLPMYRAMILREAARYAGRLDGTA